MSVRRAKVSDNTQGHTKKTALPFSLYALRFGKKSHARWSRRLFLLLGVWVGETFLFHDLIQICFTLFLNC